MQLWRNLVSEWVLQPCEGLGGGHAGQVEQEGEEDGDASNAGACANAALDIAATTLLLPADT